MLEEWHVNLAVYPGSFDPVTFGHLDVIERSSALFDRLVVAVFQNPSKTPLFSQQERAEMIRESVGHLKNVEVDTPDGLLTEYARRRRARVIVKGLRAVSDFLYEFQMAMVNKYTAPEIETVFVVSSPQYSYLSSSIVRELAELGGCLKGFVPLSVEQRLEEKYAAGK